MRAAARSSVVFHVHAAGLHGARRGAELNVDVKENL